MAGAHSPSHAQVSHSTTFAAVFVVAVRRRFRERAMASFELKIVFIEVICMYGTGRY